MWHVPSKRWYKSTVNGIATMYRVGEYVAVQDHQSEGTEWIVQITALLVYGPVNNAYAHFFTGNYFATRTHSLPRRATLADMQPHLHIQNTTQAQEERHPKCHNKITLPAHHRDSSVRRATLQLA